MKITSRGTVEGKKKKIKNIVGLHKDVSKHHEAQGHMSPKCFAASKEQLAKQSAWD